MRDLHLVSGGAFAGALISWVILSIFIVGGRNERR